LIIANSIALTQISHTYFIKLVSDTVSYNTAMDLTL